MSVAGRQLYSQGFSQQNRLHAFASPRPRALTHRQQPRRRNAAISCSTDARLASGAVSSQRCEKEAILLQRYKAHDAAITASLVLQDAGVLSPLPEQYSWKFSCNFLFTDRRHQRTGYSVPRQIFGAVEASGEPFPAMPAVLSCPA